MMDGQRIAMSTPLSAPSLRDLQRWMRSKIAASHLRVLEDGAPAGVLNPQRGAAGEARLAVYAEGYAVRLREALREVYEALHHIVGEQAFEDLARAYVQQHPSHEYNLSLAGRHLPEFLASWPLTAQLPFLPDLARLEWRVSTAFHAAQHSSIDPQQLATLSLEMWERTTLQFQPAVGLVQSAWPVLDMWQARTRPRAAIDIAVANRPQSVLVFRRDLQVHCDIIDTAQALLLEALLAGATLGTACDRLARAYPNETLPVTAWCARWMQERLIIGCALRPAE